MNGIDNMLESEIRWRKTAAAAAGLAMGGRFLGPQEARRLPRCIVLRCPGCGRQSTAFVASAGELAMACWRCGDRRQLFKAQGERVRRWGRLNGIMAAGLGDRQALNDAKDLILLERGVICSAGEPLSEALDRGFGVYGCAAAVKQAFNAKARARMGDAAVAVPLGTLPGLPEGVALLRTGGRTDLVTPRGAFWLSWGTAAGRFDVESSDLLECMDAYRRAGGPHAVIRWLPEVVKG